MTTPDARRLNPTTQNYLRQQAIRLRQQGKRSDEIASYLGVHRTTVYEWWRQYQQLGDTALQQQQRGNKLGTGRTLTCAQKARVQQLMQEHFPDELHIDSALWTRQAVQSLIFCECQVKMPIRTVGEYLKRWGMTPQKQLRRAYEQDPSAVKAWLEIEYPTMALSRDMCFFLQDDPKRFDFSLPNKAFFSLMYQIIKAIQDKGFQTILPKR